MGEKFNTIVLTGFRATGKTTVGRIVAAQLGRTFLDTDERICQQAGAPIAEIVAGRGWPFFRQMEARLLGELASIKGLVLATGGGAIEHRQEWSALRATGFIVWLDADAATIRQRLRRDANAHRQRPSLTGNAIDEEIEQLLGKRMPLYAAGADLRLVTNGQAPEFLAKEIVRAFAVWPGSDAACARPKVA